MHREELENRYLGSWIYTILNLPSTLQQLWIVFGYGSSNAKISRRFHSYLQPSQRVRPAPMGVIEEA